jgi:DNA-directed RNA polymerase I, II, and III subunit RPABC2
MSDLEEDINIEGDSDVLTIKKKQAVKSKSKAETSASASEAEEEAEASASEAEEEAEASASEAEEEAGASEAEEDAEASEAEESEAEAEESVKAPIQISYSEEEEEEEEDETYLQKFDKELREDFLTTFHPESKNHNYEEIKALSRVVRNSSGIVSDALHKTLPFLTKYEMTRVIGQRARQINAGAKVFVVVPPTIMDGYMIAKMELEQKKMPFIIKRPIPNGGFEYWNVSDLELI